MKSKGIFEDFIGIWDNNVDENICKELIKYYDWTIENTVYNISPDTMTKIIKKMQMNQIKSNDELRFL